MNKQPPVTLLPRDRIRRVLAVGALLGALTVSFVGYCSAQGPSSSPTVTARATAAATGTPTSAATATSIPTVGSVASVTEKRVIELFDSLLSTQVLALLLSIVLAAVAIKLNTARDGNGGPPDKTRAPRDHTEADAQKAEPETQIEPGARRATKRAASAFRWDVLLLTVVAVLLAAHGLGVSFGFTIQGILDKNPWLFGAVVLAILFRQPLGHLAEALSNRFLSGTVDLHLGQYVQIKLEEPPVAESAPPALPFSRSPFDFKTEPVVDESRLRFDLVPQIQILVSDFVARSWTRSHRNQRFLRDLTKARDALTDACQPPVDDADLRSALNRFVRALQAARFLDAGRLDDLRESYSDLDLMLNQIEARKNDDTLDRADCQILHCVGQAYALRKKWTAATKLLDPLVEKHHYLPAADTFLACFYNAYIEEAKLDQVSKKEKDIDKDDFLHWLSDKWEKRARALLEECKAADWKKFEASNKAFHLREVYKVLGAIYSLMAENLYQQDRYRLAENYLQLCIGTVEGEGCSALDHNNLADLYCRLGRYKDAHEQLRLAFKGPDPPESIFYFTRAEVFRAQKKPWRAIEVLLSYTQHQVRPRERYDIESYLCNQIFAAKLAATVGDLGRSKFALSKDILERAATFLQDQGGHLDERTRRELEGEIEDLRGAAYMELTDCEGKAIAALKRALKARGDESTESQWKRTILLARAHVRLARTLRRKLSWTEAARERLAAETRLQQTLARLAEFPVADAPTLGRRGQRFRMHFDALVANQELAEECFQQGEFEAPRGRLEKVIKSLWDTLNDYAKDDASSDALGVDRALLRRQLELYRAYGDFLLGRALARLTPERVAEVRAPLERARGADGTLTPWVDFELGRFLLEAAAKNADDLTLYQDAVARLESAAAAEQPAPRREALNLLRIAYVQRAALMSRSRKSPQKAD
jgi:tetratricopeptide (TPR) repeat protein